MKTVFLSLMLLVATLSVKASSYPSTAYFTNNTQCTLYVKFYTMETGGFFNLIQSNITAIPPGMSSFSQSPVMGYPPTVISWVTTPGWNVDWLAVEYSEVDPNSCVPGGATPVSTTCAFITNTLDMNNPTNCIETSGSMCPNCPDNIMITGTITWSPMYRIDVTFN